MIVVITNELLKYQNKVSYITDILEFWVLILNIVLGYIWEKYMITVIYVHLKYVELVETTQS